MWMIFAILSMVLCAFGEMFSNKVVRENNAVGPLMVYSAAALFCFLSVIVMWVLGIGESGASPVRILIENPLIILSSISTFLATFLMFVAFRYIGVSIEAVISGTSAVLLFLGLTSINFFTGKLEAVKEILAPGRLIPIIFIIVCIFLLSKTDEVVVDKALKSKKRFSAMLTGILIMLVVCIFDASDSLLVSYCIGDNQVGSMDYYIATNFMDILPGIGCFVVAMVKLKKAQLSPKDCTKMIPTLALIGVFSIGSMLTYFIGSGFDAVKLAMLYIGYPIVPLIIAGIFLKERYTAKQYFCIFGIAIGSIVFCLMDYV